MDCLGLPGEKPIMPAPPKVCPVRPVLLPELPLVALVLAAEVLLLPLLALLSELPLALPPVESAVLPVAAAGEFVLAPKLLLAPDALALPLAPKLLDPKNELLPADEAPATPFPPLGPMPATVEPVSGCPKKPIAVGALFWPNRTGFQSSTPVIGSVYLLRRKRMLLVFTSASTLGG